MNFNWMQKQGPCTYPGEAALLAMKKFPERQLSESVIKDRNLTYWRSDIDKWLSKYKK